MVETRRSLPGLPLRIRLTLWYTASLALILLLLGLFVYWQLQRSLLAQVDEGLRLVATQALLDVQAQTNRLVFADVESDPNHVRNLRDDFVVINLLGPDGSLWDRLGEEDDVLPPAGEAVAFHTLSTATERWRVYDRPVTLGSATGRLQVIQDLESVDLTLGNVLRQLLLAGPLALLAAALGGYWLASRALRPVDNITRTAQTISAEDLSRRIDYSGPPDEIGRLSRTVDDMLERLESSFERERRFTADAAHELRTPLTALKGRIDVALSRPRPAAAYIETLQELERQVDRLARLSNDLLLLSRLQHDRYPFAPERVRVFDFFSAILDTLGPLAEAKGIVFSLAVAEDVTIAGHLDLLTRLFLNLLDNAVRYTPPGGRVTVGVTRQAEDLSVAVSDTGPGISAEHLPHVFERFYRVEDDRSRGREADGRDGSGLGLALAQEIARLHGGRLFVESEPGQGSTFTVELPLVLVD